MAIQIQLQTAKVISVHEEDHPLRFQVPNVHPGDYVIPGIHTPEEMLALLTVEHRADNEREGRPVCYASVHERNGNKFIVVEVVEALTYTQNPSRQTHDRFGVKKEPDILSVAEPVRAAEVANEIERNFSTGLYGNIGIVAIAGEEATDEELAKAVALRAQWERNVIRETNKGYEKLGERQVTDQARSVAARMYMRGVLNPLPKWALVNPDAKVEDFFHCVCGAALRNGIAKCGQCGAIHDWKLALDFGLVKPDDVPPSRREQAGLPPLSENRTAELEQRPAAT